MRPRPEPTRTARAIGLLLLGLSGAAYAEAPGVPPAVNAAAQDFDGRLREQAAALKARAGTLADLPRLQTAVATDAATVRDLTTEELAFRTQPSEVIEIVQVPRNGGAPLSLWKSLDAAASLGAMFTKPGVHAALDNGTLRLVVVAEVKPRARAEEITGSIALSAAVDTAPLASQLSAIGAGGRIEVGGQKIGVGGAGPADGDEVQIPLGSEAGKELHLYVRLPRGAAPGTSPLVVGGGVGALLLVIGGVYAATRRRRAPEPAQPEGALPPGTSAGAVRGTVPGTGMGTAAGALAAAPSSAAVGHARTEYATPAPVGAPSITASQPITPISAGQRRVGRYAIVKTLGSGGMADVYLARSTGEAGFEKLVALKVMQRHIAADARLVEHFLDEARLASHLTHPNIVQTVDLGKADDEYFIAMEYIEGADLGRLLDGARQGGREVPLRVGLQIVRKVCDGLHAAHTASTADGQLLQIVHRDIKCANIFVARNGSVKIGDFGIAKASEAARSYRTRAGEIKGTAAYMAPEHRVGEVVDARADLYSVGALAYETLTGTLIDLDFMRLAHLGKEGWPHLELPSTVRPQLPKELDAIIFKALAYAKQDRYPDCAALEAAFEEVAVKHGLVGSDKQVAAWVESELGQAPPLVSPTGNLISPPRI